MRGETNTLERVIDTRDFNPLPSCEGRHQLKHNISFIPTISIHSPHARGDLDVASACYVLTQFQSTPLMRGETADNMEKYIISYISIHSPHARGDALFLPSPSCERNFNPLPSCEGRLPRQLAVRDIRQYFNPLPSCEGRRYTALAMTRLAVFQSTPLMRGETDVASACYVLTQFQSTPLMRGETRAGNIKRIAVNFNPLPSCEGRQHKLPKNSSNSRQFIQHNSFYTIS